MPALTTVPTVDRGAVITADPERVFELLGSSPQGLSEEEAAVRLQAYGPNVVRRADPYPLWRIALDQFASPIVYVLLVAGLITLLLRDYKDTVVILAVVVLNAVIGFYQEYRATRAMEALRGLATPQTTVRRAGAVRVISSEALVPGDLVLVEAGMRAAADMRLVRCLELLADESTLTGESEPVLKIADALGDPATLPADTVNVVHAGSLVVQGRGEAVVFATGSASELGRIAEVVAELRTSDTPLQRRLHRFANLLAWGMVLLALLTMAVGTLRGMDLLTVFLAGVALAVSVIPEGLPIVVTAVLSIGVRRMAERQVLVRRLPAAETMGSVDVICSDKTGTITRNEMSVETIVWGRYGVKVLAAEGVACPELAVSAGLECPVDEAETQAELEQIMRMVVLCSNAQYGRDDQGNVTASGSPTELALLRLADALFPELLQQARSQQALAEVPFSSARKFMATLQADGTAGGVLYVKGAPEVILPRCAQEWDPDRDEYVPIDRDRWLEHARRMGQSGQRVVAVAQRPWSKSSVSDEEVHGMVLWALIGISDPPRPEAAEALRGCRQSGITVIMITGDHPATAAAIARQVGLLSGDSADAPGQDRAVVTGAQLAEMSDRELEERLEEIRVFARITPHDKLRVVEALQRRGKVVAVTGDGVNDAPALRRADIGVAMGKAGTEAAREAADVVLLDDSFASIYEAVKLGRYMFENIRKVVFFLLSSGAGEVIALLGALAINWQVNGQTALPFLAAQILWINLVTNGLQDLALAFEPGEDFVLRRPPRGMRTRIFDRIVTTYTVVVGVLFGVGTLAIFRHVLLDSASHLHGDLRLAQTAAVTTMVMFQFVHAINCRSLVRSIVRIPVLSNLFLAVSLVLAAGAQLAFVYWPPLQRVFGTVDLPVRYWGYIILLSLAAVVALELCKLFVRRRRWHLR